MSAPAPENGGRWRQRRRTRKELLQAASRLTKTGATPTLEEVADEADVSRATAYRYFPNVEALLIEAVLDIAAPDPVTLFARDAGADAVARVEKADAALSNMIAENELALRLMLADSVQRRAKTDTGEMPVRQNRRTPLIEAALAPARGEFGRANYDLLKDALALVIGTEAMIVFKDVLQLDDERAEKVRHFAIRTLVEGARKAAKSK